MSHNRLQSSVLFLLTLTVLTASSTLIAPRRQSFETCTTRIPCAASLVCESLNPTTSGSLCTTSLPSDTCICRPAIRQTCVSSTDCNALETCIRTSQGSFCAGMGAFREHITPTMRDSVGLTLDVCSFDTDCVLPRRCLEAGGSGRVCSISSKGCWCFPPTLDDCDSDADCTVAGERCGTSEIFANDGGVCVGTTAFKRGGFKEPKGKNDEDDEIRDPKDVNKKDIVSERDPQPTPDGICVASRHLEGIDKLFEKDRKAWVLCDSSDNCATPGHVVHWKGSGMMMKSYCAIAGCSRRVEDVNSPKQWNMRVGSNTKGLFFTSLAARWETKLEERVLVRALRFGF